MHEDILLSVGFSQAPIRLPKKFSKKPQPYAANSKAKGLPQQTKKTRQNYPDCINVQPCFLLNLN
jgi:hypothetical protein